MLIDAHLHCTGRERADDVLRAFDEAGVDAGVLLAPFLSDGYTMHDAESLARANAYLASLVRGHDDRMIGFAVVNPGLPGAVEMTKRALDEQALRGLKMVPSGWVPGDECEREGPSRARIAPPGGSEGAKPRAWGERAGRLHVFEILGNAISGGMETSVVRLVREWPRDRFRVSALCPFESHITQALRDAGADVLVAPVGDDPPWDSVQLAASYAQDENVDVVHAHLANAHVLAALVSGLTDRPTLATIHGRAVPMLDLEAHRSSERMHMSVVCRAAYRHARAIGVAREHLHFVPNGVPVVQAPLAGGALAASLGVVADAPLVGFVGRLSPEKAPDVFVRMAAQLADRQPRPAFVVVGDGPMRERAIDCARSLGIRERIHFVGERHDVPALLPTLAVLVLTSHAEGMPLALMEAMAAGVPVVATSVGGIPELVRHDETGLLVDDGDANGFAAAVDRLLDDRAWATALGARAREWAFAHWPQHESAMRMGELLARISAGGRTPPSPHAGSAARMCLAGRAVDTRSDP